ncbi:MAG: DUF166 domain-containing protein [Promethearchaeota archaeon]
MKIYIIYQDEFAACVAGNLVNDINFCTSCDSGCNHCRLTYGSFAGNIVGYEAIEGEMPVFIEDPEPYFPKHVPDGIDVLIPIGLHVDILSGVPGFAARNKIPAVIVPVEDKNWVPFGLQKQLELELDKLGIQYAFPRPFCTLDVDENDESKSLIRRFMDTFKIGKPIIKLRIKNDMIMDGHIVRTQPCGAAFYIIQQIRSTKIYDTAVTLDERISLAHHSFPCSASMDKDPILGDSPLHVAGYLARDSVHEAIESETGVVDKARFHKEINIESQA